ncbi:MAG: NAD(P)-dependent glycerol-3-phosphate dehydrogenase [Actinomycetes bacterium]|jgi:glycerol-3-phosphate dehydrogenase (NAD(P)+)|nr:NAD(P)-dependent glycerol-3-phosphate dehydrogenase [Actinomycetes bacterium]
MTHTAVIGAGSWGTAIAWLLDGKGGDVRLWAREPEIAEGINRSHHNPVYLSDVEMSERVHASASIAEVLDGAGSIVMVTPSVGVRSTAEAMAPYVDSETPVVILSKGIEAKTSLLMTDILGEVLGNAARIAALSGPNHAEEVSRAVPSATVVASTSPEMAIFFQELFATPFFRVYTNEDVMGVELCGAGKNIIAIACGMCDGLGYGDNSKASLMTRGLAELTRLGTAVGAKSATYSGLAGMGDLIVTCTSRHSRNRGLGELLARGGSLKEFQERTKMVAEGAVACTGIYELANRQGVEVPITELVYQVLYKDMAPELGVSILMNRPQTSEDEQRTLKKKG